MALSTTQEIPFGSFTTGRVYVPPGSAITSLTWYDNYVAGETCLASQDGTLPAAAAIVQTVAAGKSYPIPFDLVGAIALKAVGNAAGTIYVSLKA
jgi:hypothetical protein